MDRLQFSQIDEATSAALRSSKTPVLAVLSDVLDAFYEHLAQAPETRRFFADGDAMSRAKRLQIEHWGVILDGRFDAAYEASVKRIGEMHHRLGLEPRWYIGAYSFLISRAVAAIGATGARGGVAARRRASALQGALIRVAMLDLELALDVYLQAGRRERRAMLDRVAGSFETSVGAVVEVISGSMSELQATAQGMTAFAQETSRRSQTVVSVAERACAHVEAAMAASVKLSASVADIGSRMKHSADVTAGGARNAGRARDKVKTLSDAVGRIGGITGLIGQIAGKTNLLALNATIEAVHAGTAGKGFAVVAEEVKQLAGQTRGATSQIRSQIEAVQSDTRDTLAEIEGISGTVETLDAAAAAISAELRNQETAAREIADNIGNASRSTMDVSDSISLVAGAVQQSNLTAERLFAAASDLRRQLDALQGEMRAFMDEIRADGSRERRDGDAERPPCAGPTTPLTARSLPAGALPASLRKPERGGRDAGGADRAASSAAVLHGDPA